MSGVLSPEDPIETLIGGFGKYQSWILFLLALGRFPNEFQLSNVIFIIPSVTYTCLDENANNGTNICPCENPQYDQSDIVSSATSEWNLICEKGYLASIAQSILQVGILVGSLIYGNISDRYGRKKGSLLSMVLLIFYVLISSVVPEFWMFLICRFLIGTSIGGVILCMYVLVVELSGKSFRPYASGLVEVSYVLGYFILPIVAYSVREWRYLQIVTSAPWLLTLSYYWLIPESPRWLITSGKEEEAVQLLTKIAKVNNRPTHNIENVVKKMCEESIQHTDRGISYLELFRRPKIRMNTIKMALTWLFCAAAYFGVNQYIGRLEGNLYVNVMIAAACLAPGIIIFVFVALHFKRKASVITSFSIAGISLLVFIFVPHTMRAIYLTFVVIGQLAAYSSFIQMYLYTSEVFPTVVRNSGLGFSSMSARVGGIVAPFIVNIGIEWISILIFSSFSFCAAIICSLLPETKGIVLRNTIDETK